MEKNCDDIKTFIRFLVQKLWQVASDSLTQVLWIMTVGSLIESTHPWPWFTSSLLLCSVLLSVCTLTPLESLSFQKTQRMMLRVNEVCVRLSHKWWNCIHLNSPWAFLMFSIAFGFTTFGCSKTTREEYSMKIKWNVLVSEWLLNTPQGKAFNLFPLTISTLAKDMS